MNRAMSLSACALLGLSLAACSVTRRHEPSARRDPPPASTTTPSNPSSSVPAAPDRLLEVPDAVPKFEARARRGNPNFYQVFGKRYYVMASSVGYLERGVASWYGPGFHAAQTSIGEPYDMYGMSAAHKTLSLPTYVRVTNLENNRSIIVRVNDRGPFVGNRIIDLSYTAAAKLDMLKRGTAFVEVRAIDPLANPITAVTPVTSALLTAPPAAPGTGLFIQAGAFASRANAERLASRLNTGQYGAVSVRESQAAGKALYRVRIGPVANVPAFDRTVQALEQAGVADAHLAPD